MDAAKNAIKHATAEEPRENIPRISVPTPLIKAVIKATVIRKVKAMRDNTKR